MRAAGRPGRAAPKLPRVTPTCASRSCAWAWRRSASFASALPSRRRRALRSFHRRERRAVLTRDAAHRGPRDRAPATSAVSTLSVRLTVSETGVPFGRRFAFIATVAASRGPRGRAESALAARMPAARPARLSARIAGLRTSARRDPGFAARKPTPGSGRRIARSGDTGVRAMSDDHDTFDLALRSVEIVDAEGTRLRRLQIFCPVRDESLDVDLRAACRRRSPILSRERRVRGSAPPLRRPGPPFSDARPRDRFLGREPSSLVPAGAIAGLKLRLRSLRRPDERRPRRHSSGTASAPALIIDEQTRVLAVVGHADLTSGETTPVLVVGDLDVTHDFDEEGAARRRRHLGAMLYHHAHKIALVRSDKTAAALLTDIDVLRWIAVAGSH